MTTPEGTPGGGTALFGHLTPRFERRVITVAPGVGRPYDEAEWRDSIVLIEQGEIELECDQGGRRHFARGDLLWFVDLSLRFVHCVGTQDAVLVAISRRRRPAGSAPTPGGAPDPRST